MPGYFEISTAAGSEYRFNLKADNHEVILTSQSYSSKQSAQGGIDSVKKNAAADAHYQRKTAKDNSPYFVMVGANGEVIGQSQMYSSASAMESGLASVKANAPTATVKDSSST